jgi:primosomal replication protein N
MGMVPQTLDQSQFQLELALFNVWSNLHEAQLEEGILGFEIWENFFKEWKESDQGRQVMLSMQVKDQGEEMSKTTN